MTAAGVEAAGGSGGQKRSGLGKRHPARPCAGRSRLDAPDSLRKRTQGLSGPESSAERRPAPILAALRPSAVCAESLAPV